MSAVNRQAAILFPLAVPEAFDYAVPAKMQIAAGDYVHAPLSGRMALGVVWKIGPAAITAPDKKPRQLKNIEEVLDAPPLPRSCRDFVDFTARYSCYPPGVVLRMVLSTPGALHPAPTQALYRAGDMSGVKRTAARAKVIAAAKQGHFTASELARRAGVGPGVVKGLAAAGGLGAYNVSADPPFDRPDPQGRGMTLTPSQESAAAALCALAVQGHFAPALLDGVTGSGKTEVYFDMIAQVLHDKPDAQVLVLLPEIALTQDVMRRFERRFGARPAQWHSDRTGMQRRRVWREVAHGRAQIVVGARSALFLPFANVRLIIVDEEHDSSFKQEEGVLYHARNMAVVRAKLADCPIVLASATPSLETIRNAYKGRYAHICLPVRPGAAVLPPIAAIDLRADPPEKGCWLSPVLYQAMDETLARGEQTLLFLNRRGYAPLTICRACGARMTAPHSSTYLVEHRQSGRLVCHLTGFSMPKPKACPHCGAQDSLHPVGPGVERLEEEVRARYPQARVAVFSSDTTAGAEEIRHLIRRMEEGEIDILIGTQMAAKGHNFPTLTLVGVVDADMGLHGADLRAGERTWQTLVQVAGRAGRADRPGRVLLQTHQPDHEAIAALCSGDREGFIAAELELREEMGFPPFGRLAALIVSASSERQAVEAARMLAAAAPRTEGVEVWGPGTPPFAQVRGRYRRRLLARADPHVDLSAYAAAWRARVKLPRGVRLKVDIDPYSFL